VPRTTTPHIRLAIAITLACTVCGAVRADAAKLAAVQIGQDDVKPQDVMTVEGNAVTVAARGGGQFHLDDRGNGFAHVDTDAPAFTFIARIADAPDAGGAKVGVALRAGVDRHDRMIAARFVSGDDGGALQWLLRHGPAKSTHDGSQRLFHAGANRDVKTADGLWLKIVRRYPTVSLSYATDGKTWQPVAPDDHFALLVQKVHVGLMVSGGDGKTPIRATFDHVSFTVDKDAETLQREDFAEYKVEKQPWQMFLIQADTKRYGPDNQTFFILKPRALAWKNVRAAIYTTGSKEIKLEGNQKLPFENGPKKRRRPKGMSEWEGVHEIDNLRPWYQVLAHYGIVRLASPGRSEDTESALREMAEHFKEPRIAHLPLMPTGESATGGLAAATANMFPKRTVGTVSVLIGMAAVDLDNEAALQSPRLYVYGSRDTGGSHHRAALKMDAAFRKHKALWGSAPMWEGYHRWWYTDRIMTPYFLTLVDQRVPVDAGDGPVELKPLKEADAYLGLNDTWDTSNPQVVSWKDATEQQRRGDTSWLPDAETARIWRAFVSNRPKTVIHFPRYDGSGGFGHANHFGRENHFLPANEPWRLVASGPVGDDVSVAYFAGLKKLKVLKQYGDSPYVVQLEPLPPGLHAIHAVVRVGETEEISHPSTVLFQERVR